MPVVEKQVDHHESQQFDYEVEIPQAVSRKYYCNNTNPNQQHRICKGIVHKKCKINVK